MHSGVGEMWEAYRRRLKAMNPEGLSKPWVKGLHIAMEGDNLCVVREGWRPRRVRMTSELPVSYYHTSPHGRTDGILSESVCRFMSELGRLLELGRVKLITGSGAIQGCSPPEAACVLRLDSEVIVPLSEEAEGRLRRRDLALGKLTDGPCSSVSNWLGHGVPGNWVLIHPTWSPRTNESAKFDSRKLDPAGRLRRLRYSRTRSVQPCATTNVLGPRGVIVSIPFASAAHDSYRGVRIDVALLRAAAAAGVRRIEAGADIGTELLFEGTPGYADCPRGTVVVGEGAADEEIETNVQQNRGWSIGEIGLYTAGDRLDKAIELYSGEEVDLVLLAGIARVTLGSALAAINEGCTSMKFSENTGCFCPTRQKSVGGLRLKPLRFSSFNGWTVRKSGDALVDTEGGRLMHTADGDVWHLEYGLGCGAGVIREDQLFCGKKATKKISQAKRKKAGP